MIIYENEDFYKNLLSQTYWPFGFYEVHILKLDQERIEFLPQTQIF